MASKLNVFVDADVIFAGAASPSEYSASNVVLHMAEVTLINAITSAQAITEVERNLTEKLPAILPEFRQIVSRSLKVVDIPKPEDLTGYYGQANPKDLPLLVAALQANCAYFLTFNTRHFFPKAETPIIILRPGELVQTARLLLGGLSIP